MLDNRGSCYLFSSLATRDVVLHGMSVDYFEALLVVFEGCKRKS